MAWNPDVELPLARAMRNEEIETFRTLLKEHPANLRFEKTGPCTWLWSAAQRGLLPFVQLLIDEFGVDVNELLSDYPDDTAIVIACGFNQIHVVQWLLDHGAKLNYEFEGEVHCASLRRAASQGHLEIVKLLVERGAYLHTIINEKNPITLADDHGHLDVAKYLRSVGAKHMCELTPPDYETGHRLIVEAIANQLGPPADWTVEVPGDPLVKIRTIPPKKKRGTRTLFTLGLSDKNLPWETVRLFQHQELRLPLPGDWRFTAKALADPKWKWPVEWLKRLVEQLRAGEYWPEEPMLFMNGDPPQPLSPTTQQSGWLCLRSFSGDGVDLPDHRCVEWHDLYPIYAEEAAFALEHGHEALALRFEERGVPLYVDAERENVCL